MEHEFIGEDSTQIFTTISVLSFSNVIEYPFIFKCEVYCRGILNFNCDAFNRTLCALITLLLICCVYWCPFCVIAIWLLVLFFFWTISDSVQWSRNVKLFLNTTITIAHPTLCIYKPMARYRNDFSQHDIVQLHQQFVRFLLKMFLCLMRLYMWGKRDETEEIVLMESFLVLMCLSTLLLLLWNVWSKGATIKN